MEQSQEYFYSLLKILIKSIIVYFFIQWLFQKTCT